MTASQRRSKNLARTVVFVGSALLLATACNYKASKAQDKPVGQSHDLNASPVPSFSEITNSILDPKCFTCHDGSKAGDFREYSNFSVILEQVRLRIRSSGSDHMPRNGSPQLTAEEITTLLRWIDEGAPENGADGKPTAPTTPQRSPTPEPFPVTAPAPNPNPDPAPAPAPTATPVPSGKALGYEQLKASVLNAKCITCHVGTDPVGDSDDFSTYSGTFAFKGSIRKRVLAPLNSPLHMPPLGDDHEPIPDRPQLTDAETQAIVNWVDAGGPQDKP